MKYRSAVQENVVELPTTWFGRFRSQTKSEHSKRTSPSPERLAELALQKAGDLFSDAFKNAQICQQLAYALDGHQDSESRISAAGKEAQDSVEGLISCLRGDISGFIEPIVRIGHQQSSEFAAFADIVLTDGTPATFVSELQGGGAGGTVVVDETLVVHGTAYYNRQKTVLDTIMLRLYGDAIAEFGRWMGIVPAKGRVGGRLACVAENRPVVAGDFLDVVRGREVVWFDGSHLD